MKRGLPREVDTIDMGRRDRVAEPAVSRAGVTGYDPERGATPVARPRTAAGRGGLDADRRPAAGRRYRAPDRPAPAGEGQ